MSHYLPSPVRQEDDAIRGVLVFGIIMAAVLFATLCVFVMWFIWRANTLHFNPEAFTEVKEVRVQDPVIGGVLQTMVNLDSSTRRLDRERIQALDGHRWVDQGAGLAQIPIEEAMRALIAGTTPALEAIAGAGSTGESAQAGDAEAGDSESPRGSGGAER